MIYLLMFIITLIFTYFFRNDIRHQRYSILITLFVFTPAWFISAMRYDVGTDYMNTYIKYLDHTSLCFMPYKTEPLFQLLNSIIIKFNLSYQWLFIVTSAIVVFGFGYLIIRYSEIPMISIIIFFISSIYFNSLNNVRQYVSLAIVVSLLFINNKPLKVILFVISVLIHNSTIVFLPIYLLTKIRFTRKSLIIVTLVLLILSPAFTIITMKIISTTKYYYFLETQTGFSLLLVLLNALLLVYTLFYYNPRNKRHAQLTNLQILTSMLCLCSMIFKNEEFWMRFTRIITITQPFLVPYIIARDKNRYCRYLNAGVIFTAFFIYTFYTVYLMGGLEVYPYQFFKM